MDGPRKMSECEGGGHERRVGTCARSGSSRYLFICWAFVAWHESMQPFYLMPLVFLSLVSKLVLRLFVVNSYLNVE